MFHAHAYYHHNLFSSALPVRSVQDHIPSCGIHGVACMTCDVKRKAYAVCNMQAQTEELMYGTLIKSTILFCIGFWVIHTRTDVHTHQARPPARTHARTHACMHTHANASACPPARMHTQSTRAQTRPVWVRPKVSCNKLFSRFNTIRDMFLCIEPIQNISVVVPC